MKINREEFRQILLENVNGFDIDQVAPEKCLADLGLDSLGFATLLFAIEDHLGVQIEESKLSSLNRDSTLKDFVEVFGRLGYEIEI
jgi:acyl carrier protein